MIAPVLVIVTSFVRFPLLAIGSSHCPRLKPHSSEGESGRMTADIVLNNAVRRSDQIGCANQPLRPFATVMAKAFPGRVGRLDRTPRPAASDEANLAFARHGRCNALCRHLMRQDSKSPALSPGIRVRQKERNGRAGEGASTLVVKESEVSVSLWV